MAGTLTIKPVGHLLSTLRQLYQAPPDAIRGIDQSGWFGPMQPVRPIAPAGVQPRAWQYHPGQNLDYTPRSSEKLTADDLRELATYPLARIIIENVKDQICRREWVVRIRPIPGETNRDRLKRERGDDTIARVTALLEQPNPDERWKAFLRPLLEDLLVIDAPATLIRKTTAGEVKELRHLDGGTIARYIDENGFVPQPPSPAFAQLWYGSPMVNLTTDQLLFCPRNVPSWKLYGVSPTEQMAQVIRIGKARLQFKENYYSEGTIPDALMIVPPNFNPSQIKEQQDWMNSDLSGSLAKRRQMRLIQGFSEDGKDQIIFPKEPLLKDEYDDTELSELCFAYGASRQRLIKQMNRASAQQAQDSAEEEGLEPWMQWVAGVVNTLIQGRMGLHDYEFAFKDFRDTDVAKQSEADALDVNNGIRTRNEVREDRGEDPRPEPEASMLGITTKNGFVPLGGAPDGSPAANADAGKQGDNPSGAAAGSGGSGDSGAGGDPEAGPAGPAGKVRKAGDPTKEEKASSLTIELGKETARVQIARQRLESAVKDFLASAANAASDAARDAGEVDADAFAETVYLAIDWGTLAVKVEDDLAQIATEGGYAGLAQLQITSADMIDSMQTLARDFAAERAAELVGMRKVGPGKYVENPDARYAISDTTRAELRTIVQEAFEADTDLSDLVDRIAAAEAFSPERAMVIARTETKRAQAHGNLDAWQKTGVVQTVQWMVSGTHDIDDVCDGNQAAGHVEIGKKFPSGDTAPPAHPNCNCSIVAGKIKGID